MHEPNYKLNSGEVLRHLSRRQADRDMEREAAQAEKYAYWLTVAICGTFLALIVWM